MLFVNVVVKFETLRSFLVNNPPDAKLFKGIESAFDFLSWTVILLIKSALSYDDAVLRLNQLTNQRNWSLNELSCRDISLEELFLGLFNQGEKNGE